MTLVECLISVTPLALRGGGSIRGPRVAARLPGHGARIQLPDVVEASALLRSTAQDEHAHPHCAQRGAGAGGRRVAGHPRSAGSLRTRTRPTSEHGSPAV